MKSVKKLSVVVLAAVALLGLGGCSGSSSSDDESSPKQDSSSESEGYPSEVRDQFMSSCLTSAGADTASEEEVDMIEDLCGCVLDAIEAEVTLDEFIEAESDILEGNASDIDLEAIAATCME